MVTNDLGACEWFVWDLRRSGLIDRGQLDQIVSEFLKRNPRAEAPALAEHLVHQGTLTAFQSERILNGKTQGLVLGPYVLLDAIGQGSMGQVYKASSKNDNNQYAIKVLPRRSMWNVRLARRQVRSFGQITHPSVVPFVDVGTAGGLHYLVWPLAEGQTLETMVQQNGRLHPQQAALIGVQVAQGLALCHQNNIFHGLVKPSNVMVGGDGQARILDFGIGSLLVENEGESLVDTMSTANTLTSGLDCASPESIMEPTNRTPPGDQYSLGCVLYYCLTGRVPFPEGSAVEKMMAHQSKEPTAIQEFAPDVPEGLVAVVARLMAKVPEQRFSTTDEVVEALEPYIGEMAEDHGAVAAQPVAAAAGSRMGANRGGYDFPKAPTPTAKPGIGSRPSLPPVPSARDRGYPSREQAPVTPPPAGRLNPPPATQPSRFQGSAPAPTVPTRASAAPARATAAPARAPVPTRAAVPSRASFQLPPIEDEIALTAAFPEHGGYSDPAALRASAGWVAEAAAESDRGGSRKGLLGTIGLIAIAMILMVLVFIGAKLLLG
ncbi:serine/threonine protein kinase [Fimbriiglobus ruber]|uniref:Serine/threonine protein kinase PrkC, regulator of stationary phase n=1 Tax=Fimbriiglobus ruber TaxID=1908690 RepID=A0A225DCH3_9BACT|nr:serine/threonine-protein kinase [Fimbriiglobus ruber]OWK36238.1 Serine/threonine protein kinase PrkC, regulator of stationary phase [Fimbriiglobus ruber]